MRQRPFNAGFAAAAMMYNQAVAVLSGVLIGRIVGAADYGIANIAKNLFQVAVVVAPLGLDLALQRFFAGRAVESQRRAVLVALRVLTFALALIPGLVLAAGLGPWLAEHVYEYRDFAAVLLVTFAALPFATDAAVTGGAYRGVRQPGTSIFATYVLLPTLRVALVVALFIAGWRLWAIVTATAAAQFLSWLYVFVQARRDFAVARRELKGAWPSARGVLAFSWVMGVSLVVVTVTKSVDVLVLGHFGSAHDVGRYVAVQLLVGLLTVFSAALGQTLGSTVSERYESGDMAGVERLLAENIRSISLVAAPLYAVILFWGDRIDLILGPSFLVEWPIVAFLATNQLLIALFAFSGFALSMTGRQKVEAYVLGVGLAATLVLCLALVPQFGPAGAAAATLVAIGGVNLLRFIVVRRLLGIRLLQGNVAAPLVLSLAAAGVVRLTSAPVDPRTFLSTAAAAVLTVVLYAGFAWILLLNEGEQQRALNWRARAE